MWYGVSSCSFFLDLNINANSSVNGGLYNNAIGKVIWWADCESRWRGSSLVGNGLGHECGHTPTQVQKFISKQWTIMKGDMPYSAVSAISPKMRSTRLLETVSMRCKKFLQNCGGTSGSYGLVTFYPWIPCDLYGVKFAVAAVVAPTIVTTKQSSRLVHSIVLTVGGSAGWMVRELCENSVPRSFHSFLRVRNYQEHQQRECPSRRIGRWEHPRNNPLKSRLPNLSPVLCVPDLWGLSRSTYAFWIHLLLVTRKG